MFIVHFIENKSVILSQLRKQIPSVDEDIKIKGRKGKVISVKENKENQVQVQVEFEKIIKKQLTAKETNKKKR